MILGHGSTEIVYSLSSQNTARKETKKFEMMKGGQEDERKNATNRMTNST